MINIESDRTRNLFQRRLNLFGVLTYLSLALLCEGATYSLNDWLDPQVGEVWLFEKTDSLPGDQSEEVEVKRLDNGTVLWDDHIYRLDSSGLVLIDFTDPEGPVYDVEPDETVALPNTLSTSVDHSYSIEYEYDFYWGTSSPLFFSDITVEVLGMEMISISAGTFECLKVVSSATGFHFDTSGQKQGNVSSTTRWFNLQIGLVKELTDADGVILSLERIGIDLPWFSGASEIQPNGWRYFSWFKGFKPEGPNWIYHGRHGWLYVLADNTSSMFLWDVALGRWMFTNEAIYPWIHAYGPDGGWIFFFEGGRPGSRYFKRGDNGTVVSEEQFSVNP